MTISKEVEQGQAVYSKPVLWLYDMWVLGISNRFIWKCPTPGILEHFNRNISSNHLDVGVGTGYFMDKCHFPSDKVRLALMDLNQNSLDISAQRVARYNPIQFYGNVLDKIAIETEAFDSISLNYLLHCLPGRLSDKLIALDNVTSLLSDSGTIFGSTILSKGVYRSAAAKKLMAIYNKKGIFSNTEDCQKDLEDFLANRFSHFKIEIRGCVALFSAHHKLETFL
ncbi:class I SAM-dependent methyltransferase [Microbulbifer sp. OS29]|uniref:Class I SAM-dependent methyltransferase n=1 Tax=Microbulbifer okhotskensis TaxID=2926617 RepID=A0A9X2J638_9GAMM|nr:methyltransferase [Microbulbifer okhotskensis]MCO1334230.1 class I SAM-dependent methyltransferase [Microbulbifer okhotskensis]